MSAPVPFLMGVRSDAMVPRLVSEGVIVVDLDKNEVLLPTNEALPRSTLFCSTLRLSREKREGLTSVF